MAAVLSVASLCAALEAPGTSSGNNATALLAKAEHEKRTDHAEFLAILQQLHASQARLNAAQQWHLKFLDAWQLAYAGSYDQAIPLLQEVIDHSGDFNLSVRATALLIQAESLSRNYAKAYALGNKLISDLPEIKDPVARLAALNQIIQMLNAVDQRELALQYIRQLKDSVPPGKDQCTTNWQERKAMLHLGTLKSDSPLVDDTVAACLAEGRLTVANALRLDQASLLVDEGKAKQAIKLLRRIEPRIFKARYQFHVAVLHVTLADAYESLGNDEQARKFALMALADNGSNKFNWTLQDAYRVLSGVAKRTGRADEALSYYEKYVDQKQAEMDDAKARALAYQMAKQQVVANQLRLDALNKQNRILQLKQSLATKAAETGRLYIIFLAIALALIAVWLYRIKHSQLRFRQLAHHDGLTGIFNRQHFFDRARDTLGKLQQSGTDACLVLLDLDFFKQVNDRHGHPAGDEVLKKTVRICSRELRETDIFGRLGGEEFGILMPACSCESGVEASNRIRTLLAATPVELDNGTIVHVSASFGLACSARCGYEMTKLTTIADDALYQAKHAGRNQLVVGSGEPGTSSQPDGRSCAADNSRVCG